jgi:hypothetical protein
MFMCTTLLFQSIPIYMPGERWHAIFSHAEGQCYAISSLLFIVSVAVYHLEWPLSLNKVNQQ